MTHQLLERVTQGHQKWCRLIDYTRFPHPALDMRRKRGLWRGSDTPTIYVGDINVYILPMSGRHDMLRPFLPSVGAEAPQSAPRRRAHGNVAVVSHVEYVPTLTAAAAFRVKAALSKAAWWPWPLTFWPWKWYSSHVWCVLSLCQF